MAGLLFGCQSPVTSSSYKVIVPNLQVAPLRVKCSTPSGPATCKCFLESDANLIIRKLKAACTALGGTEDECQTNLTDETDVHTAGELR